MRHSRHTTTDRETFLRCELGWLLPFLDDKGRELIEDLYDRAFNRWESTCNHCCKGIYFCSRPRYHPGKHNDKGLEWDY